MPGFTFPFIADQLVSFGRNQSVHAHNIYYHSLNTHPPLRRSYISGQIIAKKYAALGRAKFVRAANKDRIVESARWWKQGFEGGAFHVAISSLPQPDVSIRIGDVRRLLDA